MNATCFRKRFRGILTLSLILFLALSVSVLALDSVLYDPFDYDAADTTLSSGLLPSNFLPSFGGLLPTAGDEFFASGNGNFGITFFDLRVEKTLDGLIEDGTYRVFLNTAWYNTGQRGGVVLSDFDELYIGSGAGSMVWVKTPEPLIEDEWYTWEGVFTPSPSDIGKPFTFVAQFDLPPKRDIALDLPSDGFAQMLSLSVEIDIKPGSSRNPINLASNGVTPVAILGSESLDVHDIDVRTLSFGPHSAVPIHNRGGHIEHVNGDGHPDLVSHYRTRDTGIDLAAEDACVVGELMDGTRFKGCDLVEPIVPMA